MIDGKALAKKYAKSKDANVDSEGADDQDYSDSKAKNSYHEECMKKFIEAVHNKEPHSAHAAMVDYARGEPRRQDSEGRNKAEEEKDSEMSMEEMAKHYRKAQYR